MEEGGIHQLCSLLASHRSSAAALGLIPLVPLISRFLKVKVKSLSRVRLFVTPWTVAYQAPPSMGFSRQEYWSGLPFPSPGDLPDPGIKPRSPAFQADTLTSEPPGKQVFSPLHYGGLWDKRMCSAEGAGRRAG